MFNAMHGKRVNRVSKRMFNVRSLMHVLPERAFREKLF